MHANYRYAPHSKLINVDFVTIKKEKKMLQKRSLRYILSRSYIKRDVFKLFNSL